VVSFSAGHYAYARVKESDAQGGHVLFGFKIDARGQYNDGWNYGQTQILRTTRDATSQELTIKELDYSERFTIIDTYTKPDGTTSDVKYTVAAKADRYNTGKTDGQNGVNIIKSAWDSNSRITFSKSAGTANTKAVRIGAATSWQTGTFTCEVKDYEDDPNGVSTGYTVQTDLGTPSMAKPSIQPSSASTAGRRRAGTSDISKAQISAPGYLFFDVTVRGQVLKFYATVSA
jgi:hypothetical protein